MKKVRLVLDTNVVLSALVFSAGKVVWVRNGWRAGDLVPVVSADTIAELVAALGYPKFRLGESERGDLVAEYLHVSEPIVVAIPPEVPVCRDPTDRPFLELAVAAEADALVTGDRDLLSLASGFRIPILSPAAALERFGA